MFHRGSIRYLYYRCRSDSGGQPRYTGVNIGVFRLEQFVASVIADVDDLKSEIPIAVRQQWNKLDERERQRRLPQSIRRIVYTHSTGEVTIEINPDAVAKFATNEPKSDDENPVLGISK